MSGTVSAGRFVLVDRHLSVRLPHDQAHVVENVTVEEAAALRAWSLALFQEDNRLRREDWLRRMRGCLEDR